MCFSGFKNFLCFISIVFCSIRSVSGIFVSDSVFFFGDSVWFLLYLYSLSHCVLGKSLGKFMIAVLCSVYQVRCRYHLGLVAGHTFLPLGVSGNFCLNADVTISSVWTLWSVFSNRGVSFWQAFVNLSLV